jgi:hypothetical protein
MTDEIRERASELAMEIVGECGPIEAVIVFTLAIAIIDKFYRDQTKSVEQTAAILSKSFLSLSATLPEVPQELRQ